MWQRTCVLFRTRPSACNNIFPRRCNALGRNISGMSAAVVFSVCSHLLWWLELLTTLTDKRQIDLLGAGMQRAEQAERAQHDAASWVDLYSFYFTAPLAVVSSWHLHLKKQAPATSLCWSTDNVGRCEGTQKSDCSFSGNSFRCYPACVCFCQTSITQIWKMFLHREGILHGGERDTGCTGC